MSQFPRHASHIASSTPTRRLVTRSGIILGERFEEPQAVSELRVEFGCEIELFEQARKPCEFSISPKVCDAGGVPLSCETK